MDEADPLVASTFRNRSLFVAGVLCAAGMIGAFVAIVLWAGGGSWPVDDVNVAYAGFGVLVGAALLWPALIRPRVVADANGLHVIDHIRTQRIGWGEIRTVSVDTELYEGVVLTLVDGRCVRPAALQSGFAFGLSLPGHDWLVATAARLEDLRVHA